MARKPARPTRRSSRRSPASTSSCPIVLIAGFASSQRVLLPLERQLVKRLRRPVIRVDFGRGLGCIRRNAELLDSLIRRRAPFAYVDVVAHSMGGLIAVYLLKVLARGYRVRRVITLGTPHHGTPLALAGVVVLGLFSSSIRQMCPGSPLLRRLHRTAVPAGSQIIAIEAKRDAVVPGGCAQLSPRSRQHNRSLPGDGHCSLLHSTQSLGLVASLLTAGSL